MKYDSLIPLLLHKRLGEMINHQFR